MTALTELNWQSRRIKLNEHISAAEAAWRDAAFRREMDEVDDAAVLSAKDAVTALKDRLTALDAAWERTKGEADTAARKAYQAERAKAIEEVEGFLAQREEAATEMEKAAAALGEAYITYKTAGTEIIATVRPFAGAARPEFAKNLPDLVREVTGQFWGLEILIAGTLKNAGIVFDGIDSTAAGFQAREEGVLERATKAGHAIRRSIAVIDPAGEN